MSLGISILWQLMSGIGALRAHQEGVSSLTSFHHATSSVITLLEGCLAEFEQVKEIKTRQALLLKKTRSGLAYLHQLSAEGLDLARTEGAVDVLAILNELAVLYADRSHTVKLIAPQAEHHLQLQKVNKMRLTEALCCLVDNALHAYQSSKKVVLLVYYERKNGVQIQIQDFGQGMSLWQSQLVALPFVSFRKQGSGIGLSFAHQVIVRELGGNLFIKSEPQNGTIISCYLPKRRPVNSQSLVG